MEQSSSLNLYFMRGGYIFNVLKIICIICVSKFGGICLMF